MLDLKHKTLVEIQADIAAHKDLLDAIHTARQKALLATMTKLGMSPPAEK